MKSKKKRQNCRAIKLAIWNDYHTLGIFCKKANLIDYAKKNISMLRKPGEKLRLFELGIGEADRWGFEDIGFEIHQLREQTTDRFDAYILECAGPRILSEIKTAINDAHYWESEEMIEGCKHVMDRMFFKKGDTKK